MRTQGQRNQKNPKRKSKLGEYTSEFILDGGLQLGMTSPVLVVSAMAAFWNTDYKYLALYFVALTLFYILFFLVFLAKHKQQKITGNHTWAFRPLPQPNDSQNLYPGFLKNYGFGSTAVFFTILVMATCVGQWTHPYSEALAWCIAGWDLVIYIFSILAGMERQFNAWKRENITRNMTSAQYADFQRDEYLAERGRVAGFNEGYMVGRNSKH